MRGEEDGGKVVPAGFAEVFGGFFDGEIGYQSAVDSGGSGDVAELGEAHAQNWIEIRKDNQADGLGMLTDFSGEFKNMLKRSSVLEGALAGALDDRPIGERIAERDSEFDDARSGFDGGENDFARGGEVGIAAGYVCDERGFAFEVEGHEGSIKLSHKGPFGSRCTPFTRS